MSNSVIDSIQATETGTAFWERLNQRPSAVGQLIRDLVDLDDEYTIRLPAQHALTGEAFHKSNSQAADIVMRVVDAGGVFGRESQDRFETE